MRRARLLTAGLLLAAGTALAACSSAGTNAGRNPTAELMNVQTPMRFRRMRSMLDSALEEAGRGDGRAVRARGPQLSNEGIAQIKAVMPHDVARTDVPRYLEGRARFGEALKRWVTAVESGTDAQVIQALYALDDATRGWTDAYLGREPETSI